MGSAYALVPSPRLRIAVATPSAFRIVDFMVVSLFIYCLFADVELSAVVALPRFRAPRSIAGQTDEDFAVFGFYRVRNEIDAHRRPLRCAGGNVKASHVHRTLDDLAKHE